MTDELSARIDSALAEMRTVHNFDKGPELEIAICRLLQSFLPERAAVVRGFVVASDGTKSGDDIIVYDAARFPTLRGLGRDLSRKEWVPADAVLAYIEVKHTLYIGTETRKNGGSHLRKALQQVASLKCLHRTPVTLDTFGPRFRFEFFGESRRAGMPNVRNPWYAAIWALNITGDSDPARKLTGKICELQQSQSIACRHLPDVIAAGTVFGCPTIRQGQVASHNNPSDRTLLPRPFLARDTRFTAVATPHPIGVAVLHLSDAIDDLMLAGLPWTSLIRHQLARSSPQSTGQVGFDPQEHAALDYPVPKGTPNPESQGLPDDEHWNAKLSTNTGAQHKGRAKTKRRGAT
jgi:hypothetical protein